MSYWKYSGQVDGGFIEKDNLGAHDEYDDGNEEDFTEYEFGSIRNHPK